MLAGHGIALFTLVAACIFTVSFKGADIARLVASATSSLGYPSTVYFTPYDSRDLSVGDTQQVDVNINARVPINAIGMIVKFSQDTLEVVGISKKKSFLDLWTEETSIKEDVGEVHFSGGTLQKGGLVGTGTAITLTFRTKKAGEAKLLFKDVQVYAHDGKGTLLDSGVSSQVFAVTDRMLTLAVSDAVIAPLPDDEDLAPIPPSADVNGDGVVNIFDASFLAVRMWGSYDARYDLNMDGAIGFADISLVFSNK